MELTTLLYIAISLITGGAFGFFMKGEGLKKKTLEIEAENERKIRKAEQHIHEIERKARDIEMKAREEAHEITNKAKDEANAKLHDLEKQQARVEQKEEDLTKKVTEVERQKKLYEEKESSIKAKEEQVNATLEKEQAELEKIAKLKKDEAQEMLFKKIEQTAEKDLINHMKRVKFDMEEKANEEAREALIVAIERMAADVTTETTTTTITLPNDDYKGRIIGKEGRNIQAMERACGCDFIIDDSPGVVLVSGFDLMRRYIAKKSLEELVKDGRINPVRIEEVVEKMTKEVDRLVKLAGEKATQELGIANLPPEVVKIMGRLKFRTSYGQNVLKHCTEVGFVAEALANMVGADPELCKVAGFLHDIGKTVSHEIGGKHALLGAEILRKFGVDENVCKIVESHHYDTPVETFEQRIIIAADAVSAARPGARRETAEKFLQRMKDIENVASSFGGVKKCYAIQAGRSVFAFVDPEQMSDLDTEKLSVDISRKLEQDVNFPGVIKVTCIRETRKVEMAGDRKDS